MLYPYRPDAVQSFNTHAGQGSVRVFCKMETLNEIKLDENQYRLLMCMRISKALGQGEVYLDATTHRMCWKIERGEQVTGVFHSIDEMESHLEHLLEHRYHHGPNGLGNMSAPVKLRMNTINERRRAQTNGQPMTFYSKVIARRNGKEKKML